MRGRSTTLEVVVISLIFGIFLTACTSSTGSVNASKTAPGDDPEAKSRLVRPTMWPQPEGELPPAVAPEGLTLIEVPSFVAAPPAFYEVRPLGPDVLGPIQVMDVTKPKAVRPDARPPEPPSRSVPVQPETRPVLKTTGPVPLAPPAMTTTFGSTNFDANGVNTGFYFIPADPIGASGPNHVVDVVNVTIRFHTKAGTQVFNSSLKNFFAQLAPTTFTFDPKVVFDQYEGRFVVITLETEDDGADGNPETSRILVAVSDDADPFGTWYMFAINSKTLIGGFDHWADYPGFAIDEEAVYITCNMFRFDADGGSNGGVRLWVIDKGAGSNGFYDGVAVLVSIYDPYAGGGEFTTTQPAHVFGGGPSGVGTFLVSYSGLTDIGTGDDYVQIVRVDSPLTSPTFSQQYVYIGNIEDFSGFPNAPQSGSAVDVDTNDRRALHAVWVDSSLWMVATIVPKAGDADAGETTAYWWELDTTTLGTITAADQGGVGGEDIATGTFTSFPSIAVNGSGQVVIGYSASAASIFPGSYYTTRVPADAAGTTSGSGTLTAGTAYYVRTFGGTNRWGDYSGASIDPTNGCMWVFNKYAMTRGSGTPPEDGRWATSHGTFCISGACPADMFLAGITFTGTESRGAASRITTGKNVTLNSGSNVTLKAKDKIIIRNGFALKSGAALTVELSATPCQ